MRGRGRGWRPPNARAALRRIAAVLRARAELFIEQEVLDIGMPIAQMGGLAARAAANFDYYAGVLTELHGRAFQVGDQFVNYTLRKPVGVAALIMPWNAPLMLSTWRIAPALAAGNTIVLKPAEWSPLTATLLARRRSRRPSCRPAPSTSFTATARARGRRSQPTPASTSSPSPARAPRGG